MHASPSRECIRPGKDDRPGALRGTGERAGAHGESETCVCLLAYQSCHVKQVSRPALFLSPRTNPIFWEARNSRHCSSEVVSQLVTTTLIGGSLSCVMHSSKTSLLANFCTASPQPCSRRYGRAGRKEGGTPARPGDPESYVVGFFFEPAYHLEREAADNLATDPSLKDIIDHG